MRPAEGNKWREDRKHWTNPLRGDSSRRSRRYGRSSSVIDARRADPVSSRYRFLLQCPRDSGGGQRDLPRRLCWHDPSQLGTSLPSCPRSPRPAGRATPTRHPRRPLDRPRASSWPPCVGGSRLPNPIASSGHRVQSPRIRPICFYPPCCARRIKHSSLSWTLCQLHRKPIPTPSRPPVESPVSPARTAAAPARRRGAPVLLAVRSNARCSSATTPFRERSTVCAVWIQTSPCASGTSSPDDGPN